MDDKFKIRSPWLKFITLFYGSLGVQLRPRFHKKNLLWTIWNLMINVVSFVTGHSNLANELLTYSDHEQLLYVYWLKMKAYALYPGLHVSFYLVYHFYGPRLVECLNHPIFSRSVYGSWARVWCSMIGLEIIATLAFFGSHVDFFGKHDAKILLLSYYLFVYYIRTTWLLLLYHQIATYSTLERFLKKFTTRTQFRPNRDLSLDRRLQRSIKKVFDLNQLIQPLTSRFLIVCLLLESTHLIDSLNLFLMDGIKRWWYRIIEQSLRFSIYVAMCIFNSKVLRLFDKLQAYLSSKRIKLNNIGNEVNRNKKNNFYSKFNQHEIYRRDLYLCIDDNSIFDLSLLIQSLFYIVGMVILMYQTRRET